jgi:hypothetical protein
MWVGMPGKKQGKHPEKKLSATRVRSLSVPRQHIDGIGLYLVVGDSGSKRWILRTVVRGRRPDIGLGGLTVVSLANAREETARLRVIARNNGDSLLKRNKERRVVPTFEMAV